MKPLKLIIEKGDDDEIGGSIQTEDFLLTTVGATQDEVVTNLRGLVTDFLLHEGREIPVWQGVSENDLAYTLEYDLTSIFHVYKAIKVNSIAELAGLNKALVRQYASGVKTASPQQARRIETAIRQLGQQLIQVSIAA